MSALRAASGYCGPQPLARVEVAPLDGFQYRRILATQLQRQLFLAASTLFITQSKVNLRQQQVWLWMGCVQSDGFVELFNGLFPLLKSYEGLGPSDACRNIIR